MRASDFEELMKLFEELKIQCKVINHSFENLREILFIRKGIFSVNLMKDG